jgi:hypothetical protein
MRLYRVEQPLQPEPIKKRVPRKKSAVADRRFQNGSRSTLKAGGGPAAAP